MQPCEEMAWERLEPLLLQFQNDYTIYRAVKWLLTGTIERLNHPDGRSIAWVLFHLQEAHLFIWVDTGLENPSSERAWPTPFLPLLEDNKLSWGLLAGLAHTQLSSLFFLLFVWNKGMTRSLWFGNDGEPPKDPLKSPCHWKVFQTMGFLSKANCGFYQLIQF